MAKTIGTLAYLVTADTRKFTEGMVATRKELSAAKQIFEQTRTPAERLSMSIAGVDQLFAKGSITAETQSRAIAQLKSEYAALHTTVKPMGEDPIWTMFAKGGPVMAGATAGLAAITSGFVVLGKVISDVNDKINEQYEVLSELINSAEKLGIGVAAFQDITKAARMADVEMSSVTKSVEQMLVAVSKGGDAKFSKLFGMLHLDAQKLKAERPEQMLRDILGALEGISNSADRARIAKGIFGDVDILRLTTEQLDKAAESIEAIGGHLSDMDVATLKEMENAWKEMSSTTDVLFQRIAVALAPAWTDLANDINSTLVDIAGSETLTDVLQKASDIARGMVVVLAEIKAALSDDGGILKELYEGGGVFKEAIEGLNLLGKLRRMGDAMGAGPPPVPPKPPVPLLPEEVPFDPNFDPVSGLKKSPWKTGGVNDRLYDKDPVEESINKLKEQRLELLLGAEAYNIWKAAQEGADQRQLEEIDALQKAIKAQKEFNKLKDEAKTAIESLKTPFDKAREDIERYAEMLEEGLISSDQFTALREKRIGDLQSSQKQEEFRNPALMRGSQEALQFLANARSGSQNTLEDMASSLRAIERNTGGAPEAPPPAEGPEGSYGR